MPEEGPPVKADEIAAVASWIRAGSPPPADETESTPALASKHWAFQRVEKPDVPVSTDSWSSNPIDAFLHATHAAHSVEPVPPAARSILLQRLARLDWFASHRRRLDRFESDRSPDAFERVVDRLLATPQYGERWGRHFMDIWRYSEADGRKNKSQVWWSDPLVWRWRDWTIRASISTRATTA